MPNVTLGDMAHSFALRRQNTALKAEAQRLSTEVATGRVADAARAQRGDLVPLSAIETSLRQLQGFKAATDDAGLTATAMQAALGTLDTLAGDLTVTLLQAGSGGQSAMLGTVGTDAAGRLDAALAALDTQVGGRTVFAGVETRGAAVVDAGTLLGLLDGVVAGAVTADDVATRIADWFADPAGYAAQAYLGGAATGAVRLSQTETAAIGTTAADPAIRATVEGLALAVRLTRGGVPSDPGTRAGIAARAGDLLLSGKTARTDLAARLGLAEARIEDAANRNLAESGALTLARSALIATDDYEAAARLEATESQIETLYAVTARLSRLSLVDFLR